MTLTTHQLEILYKMGFFDGLEPLILDFIKEWEEHNKTLQELFKDA